MIDFAAAANDPLPERAGTGHGTGTGPCPWKRAYLRITGAPGPRCGFSGKGVVYVSWQGSPAVALWLAALGGSFETSPVPKENRQNGEEQSTHGRSTDDEYIR